MRQHTDFAVLNLAAHASWMPEIFKLMQPGLQRISLHQLDWENHALHTQPQENVISDSTVHLGTNCLNQAAVNLRRYDVCVIPVSLETLAWTRLALANIPRGPFTPMFGIFYDLKAAAMQDLLDLGFADFVRVPLCPDEFRARLLTVASRMPRAVSLREDADNSLGVKHKAEQIKPRVAQCSHYQSVRCVPNSSQINRMQASASVFNVLQSIPSRMTKNRLFNHETFRTAKSLVISEFEREYITNALIKHQGNIASAARTSDKHRRAFWALMRKYEIAADDYRAEA